jgi:hypothetical protein
MQEEVIVEVLTTATAVLQLQMQAQPAVGGKAVSKPVARM